MSQKRSIDVFQYLDYRDYLRDCYQQGKANKELTLRLFSQKAGLRSPNYLKLVMDGDRNLTSKNAKSFATACGLRGKAKEYFCQLVAFNQASSTEQKAQQYEGLQKFRKYRKIYKLDTAHKLYHSRWYIPAIRELMTRKDFQEDPKWIARKMMPRITPKQAQEALDILLKLELVERDEEGRLRQRDAVLSTKDGPLGYHIVTFHQTMMDLAKEALDSVPHEERDIASITLCISEKRMKELKSQLERFRMELISQYEPDKKPERVIQLNFQLFPLSGK